MTLFSFGKSSPKRHKKPAHAPGAPPAQPQFPYDAGAQTSTHLHPPPAVTISAATPPPYSYHVAPPPAQPPPPSPPVDSLSSFPAATPPPMYYANSSPAWSPSPENTGPYLSPHVPYVDTSQSYVSFPGSQSSGSFAANGSQLALDKPTSGLRGTLRNPRRLASQSFSNLRDALNQQISPPAELICQKTRLASQSVTNLNETFHDKTTQYMAQTSTLCDAISSKFDEILTCIDSGRFGGETEPVMQQYPQYQQAQYSPPLPQHGHENDSKGTQSSQISTLTNASHFSKVWLYGNARLPPYLPPLKVYMPTWPLLCLAAQYSEKAYYRPTGEEAETHIDANWRSGTKAMVLKSVPIDDMNTIVFAIRGSQTFMDWAVNFRPEPSSPKDFLDDPGNMVHAGFLYVARKMVAPVAARLRTLLSENPHRSTCSLLITGHSAGGAVAALLYAHMLSTTVQSELTRLAEFFKRVHCVTFGAPPVTLLPLAKPNTPRHRKSLFFAFINEGDPVIRADKDVIKSLLRLYANPAPSHAGGSTSCLASLSSATLQSSANVLGVGGGAGAGGRKTKRPQHQLKASSWSAPVPPPPLPMPSWKVPPGTLSCAGKLVLLRDRPGGPDTRYHAHGLHQHSHHDVDLEACVVEDEMLRGVVFGDPVCHMMRLYARRIEVLATRAVTVGGMGEMS